MERDTFMTKEQKLTKIIKIAIGNGWDKSDHDVDFATYHNTPEILLFDHDFAKAYWGEEWYDTGMVCENCKCGDRSDHLMAWKHHLQQAVLAEDLISYYWENR